MRRIGKVLGTVVLFELIAMGLCGCGVFLSDWGAEGKACRDDGDCKKGLFCIDGACDDPCDPNPCTEEHKTQCENDGSGNAICSCDPGYHDEDGLCVQDQVCQGDTCSGHGTCDDTTGVTICTCDEGYTGVRCESCAPGYHDEEGVCVTDQVCQGNTCSGHGTCDDSTWVTICTCDEGYTGDHCETCAAGYQDNDGDGTCLANCATSGLNCGLHGTCDDSGGTAVCVCDAEYTGAACDTCAAGYQDNDGDGTCQANCATSGLNCGLHATCDDSSGVTVCTCDGGWGGPDCSVDLVNIEWVAIPGGTFWMGSDSGNSDEQPVHQVTVPGFEMSRTEVTVSHYQKCVDAVECTEPSQCGSYYNWGVTGREDHPVNCVDWQQAVDFCAFAGGRLPSEAEWEYAARGGGQDITYPWGDQSPSCTYAVMFEGGDGCGEDRTWAVCSKTAGNTAQGLCDMAGNVYEWVQDWYHSDYNGAPSDGSAWESPSSSVRVLRGNGFSFYGAGGDLRAASRTDGGPSGRYGFLGCRCVRDAP